jgi:assimilatory nitrate reductase catalytic subunit
VLRRLAQRLGGGHHLPTSDPERVFAELAAVSAGGRSDYSGMTWDRLGTEEGLQWPCPAPGHQGTPRLFADRFAHPDGRARFVAVRWRPPAEVVDDDYPIWFTTGRYKEHYNSGAQTRAVPRLRSARPEARLQLHPLLAARLAITDDAPVAVESRRGRAVFTASVDPAIRADTVFAPFHWGGAAAANLVTNTALDPTSRMPELKVCAVRVVPVETRP